MVNSNSTNRNLNEKKNTAAPSDTRARIEAKKEITGVKDFSSPVTLPSFGRKGSCVRFGSSHFAIYFLISFPGKYIFSDTICQFQAAFPNPTFRIGYNSPMKKGVVVNGRFQTRRVTGVERYSHEVSSRIQSNARLVRPGRPYSGIRGHFWEQFILPRLIEPGESLWSPANSGPLHFPNQVLSLHDLSVIDHPEWFSQEYALWHRFLLSRLINSVKAIITMSNFSKTRIMEYFGLQSEMIHCIPEGVDPLQFHSQPEAEISRIRRRFDLKGDFLLLVASLEPRKNIERLLDAWKRISSKLSDKTLVIAGGKYRVFKEIDTSLPVENVRWLGYVEEKDLPGLYSTAQAYILPSLYEGFGLSVLGAMACGTPVIAANSGALPEVAAESALYFDPQSVDSIAQVIEAILCDPTFREELKKRGLERSSLFSWDRTAQEIWQVLESFAA